jgi:hypothetical protein
MNLVKKIVMAGYSWHFFRSSRKTNYIFEACFAIGNIMRERNTKRSSKNKGRSTVNDSSPRDKDIKKGRINPAFLTLPIRAIFTLRLIHPVFTANQGFYRVTVWIVVCMLTFFYHPANRFLILRYMQLMASVMIVVCCLTDCNHMQ